MEFLSVFCSVVGEESLVWPYRGVNENILKLMLLYSNLVKF